MGSAIADRDRGGLRSWRSHPEWWLFALLGAIYVVVRVTAFSGVTSVAYRDSESYLDVAGQSLLSADFWAGARPWTVPLLYKLLPGDDSARTIGQLVLSLAGWGALAGAVARVLRPRALSVLAFGAVLAFSLSFAVIRWDVLVLSESVSISLTAAVAAAWLELLRAPRRAGVLAVLVLDLLWVFSRDSNAYLALATAVGALIWLARPGPMGRRWPAILALGLIFTFAASVAATGTQEAQLRRNERPLLHVVGRRVLINPRERAFFLDHGMPRPTAIVLRHRKILAAIGDTIPSDPPTDAYLRWVREHGRSTLARYLIAHPGATLRPLVKFRKRLLGGVTQGYRSPDARMALPEPVASALYPHRVHSVLRWLMVTTVLTLLVALAGGASRMWLVPAGLIVLQLPHALLVYHGDTLEIPRHAILMAIMLRLGILMLALFAVGGLLERVRERGGTVRTPAEPEANGPGAAPPDASP